MSLKEGFIDRLAAAFTPKGESIYVANGSEGTIVSRNIIQGTVTVFDGKNRFTTQGRNITPIPSPSDL